MIYTVTFNPSLDYIVSVDDFKLGLTNRTSSELILPGGKGTNVSTVLKNLGFESTALGFVAGFTGNEIVKRLNDMGIKSDFISIEKRKDFIYDDYQIDEEFIETVKEMLPAQPWQVGIHKTIAAQLGCPNAKVSRTIETLIDTGIFKKQINGQIIES